MIDRDIFFDKVRQDPFAGSLTQQQVDGMTAMLDVFEAEYDWHDLRWPANCFAQTMWETSSKMLPIEEYGKGEGQTYGALDPTTKQTYYGRGFVQLTWRENYAKADSILRLTGDRSCEWHAENALLFDIAAEVLFQGMADGWFRSSDGTPNGLNKYFNDTRDDPFEAREILNGDKNKVPSWSAGATIGMLIADYHQAFLRAFTAAAKDEPEPGERVVTVSVVAPPGVRVEVRVEEA
jgi:hypothetical protein